IPGERRVHVARAAREGELRELRCRAHRELAQPAPCGRLLHHHVRRAARARPGFLSMRYFPLFLDVAGKPVLLVGGGGVAARKFALLAAAGAAVTIVAPVLCDELAKALAQGALLHEPRDFAAAGLDGRRRAVAAT